jgi:hypothetical protein
LWWEGYIHDQMGVKRNIRTGETPMQSVRQAVNRFHRTRTLQKTGSGIFLQLFGLLLCPVIETQSMVMNRNIIYLDFKTPDTNREQGKGQGNWIRIENDAAFKIIDTLLVFWLGAWSLIAGVEFLRATGSVLF